MIPREDKLRGVRLDRRSGASKYEGRVYIDARHRYLGNYASPIEAAYAVNVAYRLLIPGKDEPNPSSGTALTGEQRDAIRARVALLLDPGREPHQRSRPRRAYE